ncbi:MAG: ABC transporter permease [Verrucomicrobiae bacterium]|nr:ABC transporter permease [Verrucomicrobiae bacterium]
MNWFSLAFRNLLRNARRSITTIAAVALGYAAVNILGGFATYMFVSIREAFIYDQANGHVQVWKEGARTYGGSDPGAYLLSAEEFAEIKAFAETDPRVILAAGMLEVKGNLDHDGVPAFFLSRAMTPSDQEVFYEAATSLRSRNNARYRGKPITDQTPFGIGITEGMAENLKLEIGGNVILMAPTVQGQMNAADAEIYQVMDMPAEALNGKLIFMPLELAHTLYDTGGVSSVKLLLKNQKDTDAVVAELKAKFPDKKWDTLPWYEVSELYNRTKRMFDIIFGLVFVIIITIVTMSVVNTIGMAVIERTREIGTLRAIGLKRPGVIRLFGIESALLGLIGAFLGLLITVSFSLIVAAAKPLWNPPLTTRAVIWQIKLVPDYLILTFVLLVIFTFLAAIMPARRAAWRGIVDSLGHV